MDSGTPVDLMLTTNDDQNQAFSVTLPVLPRVRQRTAIPLAIGVRKYRSAATIATVFCCAAIAIISVYLTAHRNSSSDRMPNPSQPYIVQNPHANIPKIRLKPAYPASVRDVRVVRYQPKFDGSVPSGMAAGSLTFRLGKDQWPGMSVHPVTGLFEWLTSDNRCEKAI